MPLIFNDLGKFIVWFILMRRILVLILHTHHFSLVSLVPIFPKVTLVAGYSRAIADTFTRLNRARHILREVIDCSVA